MFKAEPFINEKIKAVEDQVGDGKAIIAVSGGVDSMVCAALASKALGKNLLAIFVNTGLMRKDEPEEVRDMLTEIGINFKIIDAQKEFFAALKGITDPEAKRKAIGEKFIRVFEKEAKGFGAEYLVQGTIAPDCIESGGNGKKTIKSHHNVGGLPEDVGMELVEPLKDLYKEEVREVARKLNVKSSERQPFPGPALAVRCLGEVTPGNIATVREACFIVEDEIKKAAKAGKMKLPWQYFAVLLPVRSVGVRGDERAYGKTVVVRAVESADGMTATHADIPGSVLSAISKRITSDMEDINRVVYDITDKPPGTIEWE